jgi:hypothetical protein
MGFLVSGKGGNIERRQDDINETCSGWIGQKQKLICLMAVDEGIGAALSRGNSPFFRAFIVEDRSTYHISANVRFRFDDHVSWYRITLKEDEQQRKCRAEKVAQIQEALERILAESLTHYADGVPPPNGWITCHYPPDDQGHWQRTVDWMLMKEPRSTSMNESALITDS